MWQFVKGAGCPGSPTLGGSMERTARPLHMRFGFINHVLGRRYQQYLRQASLQAANDRISNAIAELPIFPHYSFDLGTLYGAVDGQKFGVERPTVKAHVVDLAKVKEVFGEILG